MHESKLGRALDASYPPKPRIFANGGPRSHTPDEVFAIVIMARTDSLKGALLDGSPNYAGVVLLRTAIDIVSSVSLTGQREAAVIL
jgi:hypothetical protein